MKMNKRSNAAFIAACRKAGLKVNNTIGDKVSEGLIVKDGYGHSYLVDEEGKLTRTDAPRYPYRMGIHPVRGQSPAALIRGQKMHQQRRKKIQRSARHRIKKQED